MARVSPTPLLDADADATWRPGPRDIEQALRALGGACSVLMRSDEMLNMSPLGRRLLARARSLYAAAEDLRQEALRNAERARRKAPPPSLPKEEPVFGASIPILGRLLVWLFGPKRKALHAG